MHRLPVLLILLALGIFANSSHWLPSLPPAHAQSSQPVTTVSIIAPNGSNNITDLGNSQTSVTFAVDISIAPAIDGFLVILQYDTNIFSSPTVDLSGSVLGSAGLPFIVCIDGIRAPISNGSCLPTDATGVITSSMVTQGNVTSPTDSNGLVNGPLFHVTFKIAGIGLGQVHIFLAEVDAPPSTRVPVITEDGYYTNLKCGIAACRAPSGIINVTPQEPLVGSTATFNATIVLRNTSGVLKSLTWDWGDNSGTTTNQTLLTHVYSPLGFGGGAGCTLCRGIPVTVVILDSYSITWKVTIILHLQHPNIVLSVSELTLNHQFNVVPGTEITISVKLLNRGNIAERGNLTIYRENTVLKSKPFNLNSSGSQLGTSIQLSDVWNTTGYTARAYAISASVCEQHCSTKDPLSRLSGVISAEAVGGSTIFGMNNTSEASQTLYVFLVVPQSLGAFSLSLFETTGLGILVLIAAGLALTRFLKKPSYETEPL